MNVPYLMSLLASALALILGIVVHESAHALAAYLLGDRTARPRAGSRSTRSSASIPLALCFYRSS